MNLLQAPDKYVHVYFYIEIVQSSIRPNMKLEKAIFQKSYYYFIAFFLLVITGFWATYFTRLQEQENYRMHAHGIILIMWCLLLLVQPLLIRMKKTRLHRSMGKYSYLLVPLLVYTTIDLLRYQLKKVPELGAMDYYFTALVVNALVAFLIFYGLAIYHRKHAVIHARYMICTVFPFITPATDRIIHIHISWLLQYMPTISGKPIAPVAGFLLADLVLIVLSIWDWRTHRRWNVFPIALIVLLGYQYSVLNFYRFESWQAFSHWLVGR